MTALQQLSPALIQAGGQMHFGSVPGPSDMILGGVQLYDAGKVFRIAAHVLPPAPAPLHEVLAARLASEFIEPALGQPTPDAFRAFWKKCLGPFRRVFHAYAVASETAGMAGTSGDGEPISLAFVRAARILAGATGEEFARTACVDVVLASETIDRFADVSPRNPEEDGKQATRHNVGWMLFVAYGLSMVHAVQDDELELSPEMISELVMGLQGWANTALNAAREGAALRGLSVDVPLGTVEDLWVRPCEAMFTYIARRAPRQLGKYIEDQSLNAGLRARAATAAKAIEDASIAIPMLLKSLNDPALIVQEGSVYGLQKHLTPEVIMRLREKLSDPATDDAIRETIEEALELS